MSPSILQWLSIDILLGVGDQLGDKDLAYLAQTNAAFSQIFSRSLWKRSLEDKPSHGIKIPALLWAINHGHQHLVQRIVSQPDFNIYAEIKEALHDAAAMGHLEIISILIEAGYNVNSESNFEWQSPLHITAMNGHPLATKMLLDHGGIIDEKDRRRKTPFDLAIESQPFILQKLEWDSLRSLSTRAAEIPTDSDIQLVYEIERRVMSTIRILVENGAHQEIFMTDKRGNTPLHRAAVRSINFNYGPDIIAGTGVLRYLVRQGANIHALNYSGRYPIHKAAMCQPLNKPAVSFFLDMGISPNLEDFGGLSLLNNALCTPNGFPIVELLVNRGARTDGIRIRDFFHSNNDYDPESLDKILTLFLSRGIGLDGDEAVCFTLAAYNGDLNTMKVIFEKGADINTCAVKYQIPDPHTPLQIAIMKGRKDMLVFLVERGVRMSKEEKGRVEEIFSSHDDPGAGNGIIERI